MWLVISGTLAYLTMTGLFRHIWLARRPEMESSRTDGVDSAICGVFWPVYLLYLIGVGCLGLPVWVIGLFTGPRVTTRAAKQGIESVEEYRRLKKWIADYEAKLPIGER